MADWWHSSNANARIGFGRTCHEFWWTYKGWKAKVDGSGASYLMGSTYNIQQGYTVHEIWGYVDTQGGEASWITLSNNRAKAVNEYMTKNLSGGGVLIKNAGRAQIQAVGNNKTTEG